MRCVVRCRHTSMASARRISLPVPPGHCEVKPNKINIDHRAQTTQTQTQTHPNCRLGVFLTRSNAKLDMHKYPQTPSARSTFPYADCRGKQPCSSRACLHFSVATGWDCCQEIKWQNVGIARRGTHWIKTAPHSDSDVWFLRCAQEASAIIPRRRRLSEKQKKKKSDLWNIVSVQDLPFPGSAGRAEWKRKKDWV